jgi:hypothetical protein
LEVMALPGIPAKVSAVFTIAMEETLAATRAARYAGLRSGFDFQFLCEPHQIGD